MNLNELKNKKIAILGYWKEWKSTEKFFKRLWINDYEILDRSSPQSSSKGEEVKGIFWNDYIKNLDRFDIIFKSPWISPYNNLELLKVKEKITSQAEILADNFEGKIIWITGTKGKSTTSTLLYEMLKEFWYKVKLVWNIWNPVLDEIDILSWEKYDYIVYELSSYMLEGLELNIFIGLLNNIYDCHLDWHNWRKNYQNAKFNIFKNAKYKLAWEELKNSLFLQRREIREDDFQDIIYFWNNLDKFWIKPEEIALKWEHNYKNISWILNILELIKKEEKKELDTKKIKKILSKFNWLPHRQENIWTYKWITFINDAIASTPESAIAAIRTFWDKIWTVFIWNEDSGFDLTELKKTIEQYKIPNIVLFPTTWEKLFWDFSKNMKFDIPYPNPLLKEREQKGVILKTLSMENAVKFAFEKTKKWQIVLLSTGAPSFNAKWPGVMCWKSYIEKWEMFKKYVKKYWQ